MKCSTKFIDAICYSLTNRKGFPYRVLHIFDNEILIFGDMVSGKFKTDGDLCIPNFKEGDGWLTIGTWREKSNIIELRIFGKGTFIAKNISSSFWSIYKAEPENGLEKIIFQVTIEAENKLL